MLKKNFQEFKKACDEVLDKYNSTRSTTNPYGCMIADLDDAGATFGAYVDDCFGSPNLYYEQTFSKVLEVKEKETDNTVAFLTVNLYRTGINSNQIGGNYETNAYLLEAPRLKASSKLKY